MPSARFRRRVGAGTLLVLAPLVLTTVAHQARADGPPPTASLAAPEAGPRRPFPPRGASPGRRAGAGPEGSGGWWVGTAGIALALAVCGGISVASRRYLPARQGQGPLRVVGRTSLSPKHTVYLLEVGDRVLIVGAGSQGPPSLLGEITDPVVHDRLGTPPRRTGPDPAGPSTVRFDRRVGDDE